MTLPYQPTIRYRTYLKTAMVEALQTAFKYHPDPILKNVKVRLDFSFEEVDYPTILVRYYQSDFKIAGVGHREIHFRDDGTPYPVHRSLYHGNMEFSIYALTSLDRDLISDSLVQILGSPTLLPWTNYFALRLYDPETWAGTEGIDPDALQESHLYHFTTINTDSIGSGSEAQVPAPWQPEDVLLYNLTHTVPIFGEVETLPADIAMVIIEKVIVYPYIASLEPIPTGTDDPAPWILGD